MDDTGGEGRGGEREGQGAGPGARAARRQTAHRSRRCARVPARANTEQLHRGDTPRLDHPAAREGHGHAARGHSACYRAAAQAAGAGGLPGQLAPKGRAQ